MDGVGVLWLSGCGLATLLVLALITSGVAVRQLRNARRYRREAPAEHRTALAQGLMALGTALAFWLLVVVGWLLRDAGRTLRLPWLR